MKDIPIFIPSKDMYKVDIIRIPCQRYTYRVLQTIQMKLILLCVCAGTMYFNFNPILRVLVLWVVIECRSVIKID